MKKQQTSWQPVNKWYKGLIRAEGSYYHEHIVIPGALRLLNLKNGDRLLDLGCGEGILARKIPANIDFVGVDISPSLIAAAKKSDKNSRHKYVVRDVTKEGLSSDFIGLPVGKRDSIALPIESGSLQNDNNLDGNANVIKEKSFSHACFVLSLQNISDPQKALSNTSQFLTLNSKLLIVLNHPCFRIPRQTSWGFDEQNKIQYRRVNRYLTPLKIPINMHPGQQQSPVTWSYHNPISQYSDFLQNVGFVIEKIEEWTSDKASVGKAAGMENLARREFPLFMAIVSRKLSPPK